MISFRQHVVSLVAVFLALAVGIVLGGGPMSAVGQDLGAEAQDPEARTESAEAQARADYGDRLVGALARRAYGDGLAERPVAVLSFPGVDPGVREDLVAELEAAGGEVTGQYELLDTLVAPGEKSLVDSLGSQLAAQREGVVAEGSTTYDRVGQLVARSVAVRAEEPRAQDEQGVGIARSLVAADLLDAPDRVERRAPYLLVLLGGDSGEADDPIWDGLLTGLARGAQGVVVAGTTEDGRQGRLSRLREEPVAEEVATVDGVDHTSGLVTSVLALARWPETRGGAFGASGSDGTVPIG